MDGDDENFDPYIHKQDEAFDDFLKYCRSEIELRQTISYLIEHRELMRDMELARLEKDSAKILAECQQMTQDKLIEEIQCFKDVLALQKKLLQVNGKTRN